MHLWRQCGGALEFACSPSISYLLGHRRVLQVVLQACVAQRATSRTYSAGELMRLHCLRRVYCQGSLGSSVGLGTRAWI